MRPLLNAWREGDEEMIESQVVEKMRNDPGLKETFLALFTDRNAGMARRVEEGLKGDRVVFVVVGAGRLIGAESVVALLHERGYEIERR